jgi:hypothetical protein
MDINPLMKPFLQEKHLTRHRSGVLFQRFNPPYPSHNALLPDHLDIVFPHVGICRNQGKGFQLALCD